MSFRYVKNWLAAAFVVVAILAAIMTLWSIRATLLRMEHYQDLKWITLALHQYHDEYGSFPPPTILDKRQVPIHSWRSLLQMHLADDVHTSDDFTAFDLSQPWDSPQNIESARRHRFGRHAYQILAVVGPHAAWDEHKVRKITDFQDGTSKTVLAIALRDSGTQWNEPCDLTFDGESLLLKGRPVELNGEIRLLMADGMVHHADGISWDKLRPMLTIDGGEKVDSW